MAKVADFSGQSVGTWVAVSSILCLASLLIPLPFLRVLIALVASGAAMFVVSMMSKPKSAGIVGKGRKTPP